MFVNTYQCSRFKDVLLFSKESLKTYFEWNIAPSERIMIRCWFAVSCSDTSSFFDAFCDKIGTIYTKHATGFKVL